MKEREREKKVEKTLQIRRIFSQIYPQTHTHSHKHTRSLIRSRTSVRARAHAFSIFQYKSYLSSIKFKQIGSIFRINNVKLLLLFLAHFTTTKRRRRRGRGWRRRARRRHKSLIFNGKTGSNEMLVTWKKPEIESETK